MGKRGAEHQISKETYDSENDNEAETGTFCQATEATISKRRIIAPRSRLNGNNLPAISGGGTMKAGASPFGGFSFGTTSQATASTNPAVIGAATSDSSRPNSGAAASPFGGFSFVNAQKSSSTTPLPPVAEKSTPSVTASAAKPLSEPTSRNPFASFAFSTAKTSAPSTAPSSQLAAPTASASVGNVNTGFSFNASPSEKQGLNGSTPLFSAKPPKETTYAFSSSDSTIDARTHLAEDDTDAPTKRIHVLDRLGTNAESSREQRELTELYAFLAALNRTLLAHLTKVVADYPLCDMANVLEDYQKARDEIINIKCASAARKVGLTSTSLAHPSGSSSTSSVPNKTSPAVVKAAVSTNSESTMQNTAFGGWPKENSPAQTADSLNDVNMESDNAKTNMLSVGTGSSIGLSGFAFGKKVGNMEADDVKENNGSVSGFNFKSTNTSNLETTDATSNKNPTASLGFSFPKPSTPSDNVDKSTATGIPGFSFNGNTKPIHGFAFGKLADPNKIDEKPKTFFPNFEIQSTEGAGSEKTDGPNTSPLSPVFNAAPTFSYGSTAFENTMIPNGGEGPKPITGFGFGKPSSVSTENHSALGFGKPASFGATGFSFGGSAASTGEPVNNSLPSSVADKDKGEDDVPEGEEESFKQNRTNDELIRKGAGEEDEESLHEVLCKVFKPSEGGTGFTDLGKGILKVNRNTKSNSRRLLCRQEGSGKVILNAPLYTAMKIQEKGARGIGFLVFDDKGAMSGVWLVRVGTPEVAKNLRQLIEEQVELMKQEKEAAKSTE